MFKQITGLPGSVAILAVCAGTSSVRVDNEKLTQYVNLFIGTGFYSVNPAELKYQSGSPILQKAIIEVAPGKYFTMNATETSVENKYIQQVRLNGEILDSTYITHQEIIEGGTLEFKMGPEKVF